MPTFGRLGKHSNRSQHGLPEQQQQAAGAQASGASNSASTVSVDAVAAALADSTMLDAQSVLLPSATGSPHEAIDIRQQQQLQQHMPQQQQQPQSQGQPILHGQGQGPNKLQKQQAQRPQPQPPSQVQLLSHHQPPAPPPHLYSAPSAGTATNNPSPLQQHPGSDFIFDARQQQQPPEFTDPTVNRSQSLHYPSQSSPLQQQFQQTPLQQQVYGVATSSVDDLPSPASFQHLQHPAPPPQPAPPPEKQRSNRKLHIIKGIFGSVRGTSDTSNSSQNSSHAHTNPSFDPSAGLFRRTSTNKRDSRLPPLAHTLRSFAGDELDNSSLDEIVYQPPLHPPAHQQQIQQQSPGQLLNPQDQQLQFDNSPAGFDIAPQISQQQQLHQQILFQQTADVRLPAGYPGPQNPETASQLSHESPAHEQEPRNQITQTLQMGSAQNVNQQQQHQPGMASQGSRRSHETEQPVTGHAPGYRHSNSGLNPTSPMPPQGATPVYRGDRGHFDSTDQGRETPQPNAEKDAESEKAFKELLTKYKNVKRLYFEGKDKIEQLNSQVEQLQNAVANQRMSQSRTALDDSEYATRFSRLNGAINNLSFNIRKDWRTIPQWLANYVSADALKTGKQEMTAVGRAVISRWLVAEFFDKCFHPDLDLQLSTQLKDVEMGIRGNTHTMHRPEEFGAQTTKIVNWRMATLDGLQKRLGAQAAAENRAAFTKKATLNLTTHLLQYLADPPPAGCEGSAAMIVELAISVAINLPLESRDVSIWYPMPAEIVQPNLMEVEKAGLPSLTGAPESDEDPDTEDEPEKHGKGHGKSKSGATKEPKRVRFAGFPALEVKGRHVLLKAPVWTM